MAEEMDVQRLLKVVETTFEPKEFGFRDYIPSHAIILTFSTMECFCTLNIPWYLSKVAVAMGRGFRIPIKSTGGL